MTFNPAAWNRFPATKPPKSGFFVVAIVRKEQGGARVNRAVAHWDAHRRKWFRIVYDLRNQSMPDELYLEPLRRERRDALYFASLPDGPEVNF